MFKSIGHWFKRRKAPLIIHYHLFKNAGTTFESILRRNFPDSYRQFDDVANPYNNYHVEDLKKLLEAGSAPVVISSHQLRLPVPDFANRQVFSFIFLRDPFDRAASVYNYEKKRAFKVYSKEKVKAKNGEKKCGLEGCTFDMQEFFETLVANRPLNTVSNFQALMLSYYEGIQLKQDELNEKNFATACRRLDQISLVGIVERFDESMIVAENILRPVFGKLDLSYISRNVNRERKADIKERIEEMRRRLTPDFFDKMKAFNAYDNKLYSIANSKLDKSIRQIGDFQQRLDDFRERCAQSRSTSKISTS